jgi:CubicO group peptidase (beta-lactamase class C family)
MRSRILSVSVPVCVCTVVGCARQDNSADRANALDSYIDAVMERFEIPGLTLAVTRSDQVLYTGAFGVRSLDSGERMQAEYLFHMASVSKPFVATTA